MENLTITEEKVVSYLLGELSEKDQSDLEERFILDSETHTLLCEVEDDLIADYVRGRLEPHDLKRFEGHYLSTYSNRERVRVARVFLPMIDEAVATELIESTERLTLWQKLSSSVPILRWAIGMMAALGLFLFAWGGSWTVDVTRRMRDEVDTVRMESKRRESELLQQIDNEKRRNIELANEIEQLRKQLTPITSPPKATAALRIIKHVIVADTLRDDKARPISKLIIPPETERVQLDYKMEDPGYPSYRAELYSSSGEKIWSSEGVSPLLNQSVATLTITLPASEFANGSYTLSVSGLSKTGSVDPLSKPTFQVEKR
jgi:hypothetical protein